jgi:hypothetical protein
LHLLLSSLRDNTIYAALLATDGITSHNIGIRFIRMNQAEDVEIILGHKRRYKFHSGTLARNSTLFADMLSERNAAKLNSRARSAGVKIRWMIELARLPDEQFPAGCLELVVRSNCPWTASGAQTFQELILDRSSHPQASARTAVRA